MRDLSLLMSGLVAVAAAWAQAVPKSVLKPRAEVYTGPQVRTSMWIWSDKYVYQPGQSLTLRWTVKTNNDLYPYTVFVYRQDNQTGVKTYYPSLSSSPSDMNGNTQEQGYQPTPLQDRTKAVLLGLGGIAPAVTIPSETGMHTFVVELRDYTGTRPLKTSYMKIGVVNGSQTISGEITQSRTLTNDTQWNLSGVVYVKNGAVLTIQPGTFIFGQPGTPPNTSVLVVTRAATIEAHGTAARPITLTSSQPFGQRTRGDWGGLVVLGRAPVNLAAGGQFNNPTAGEGYIEGLQTTPDGLYGGNDPTHYCGTLTYVRSEFAGAILSEANEVNSITFGGCGTRTVAHHLQAKYGRDDAFEWFGGTMNASYPVGGLGADDCLDFQLGFTGKVQYAVCYQSPDANGARGMEGDNSEFNNLAEPFSNPTFFNVTMIGIDATATEDNPANGMHLRRGARGSFNNIVLSRWRGPAVLLNDINTQTQATNGNLKMNGILLWHNRLDTSLGGPSNSLAGNIAAATNPSAAQNFTLSFLQGTPVGGAQNIVVADPLLARPLEYSDPDWTGLFGSPIFRTGWVQPPDDGVFDQSPRFIGAFGDIDWTAGWANFLVEADIAP
jgi:hypothetical protein